MLSSLANSKAKLLKLLDNNMVQSTCRSSLLELPLILLVLPLMKASIICMSLWWISMVTTFVRNFFKVHPLPKDIESYRFWLLTSLGSLAIEKVHTPCNAWLRWLICLRKKKLWKMALSSMSLILLLMLMVPMSCRKSCFAWRKRTLISSLTQSMNTWSTSQWIRMDFVSSRRWSPRSKAMTSEWK